MQAPLSRIGCKQAKQRGPATGLERRLLRLMQLMDVWDVLVVVTRWYGGTLLGPDRFRIINNVGKDALMKGGFQKETPGAKDKGKKKGKK